MVKLDFDEHRLFSLKEKRWHHVQFFTEGNSHRSCRWSIASGSPASAPHAQPELPRSLFRNRPCCVKMRSHCCALRVNAPTFPQPRRRRQCGASSSRRFTERRACGVAATGKESNWMNRLCCWSGLLQKCSTSMPYSKRTPVANHFTLQKSSDPFQTPPKNPVVTLVTRRFFGHTAHNPLNCSDVREPKQLWI